MTRKSNAWMPLYIGDYLADTMHLDAETHGAYLLLIMHYWRTGPLPRDEDVLQNIARVATRSWRRKTGRLVLAFFTPDGDVLRHKRIDKELAQAADISDKRRRAAQVRHGRGDPETPPDEDANAGAHADANGAAPDMHSRARAVHSQSHLHKNPLASLGHASPVGAVARESPRRKTVGEAVEAIRRLTGRSNRSAWKMAGMMLRNLDDDTGRLADLLARAEDLDPADASEWLMASVRRRDDELPAFSEWAGEDEPDPEAIH